MLSMTSAEIWTSEKTLTYLSEMALCGKLPRLVTISGGTCSGKTTFAAKMLAILDKIGVSTAIVPLDSYYRDRNDPAFPRHGSGHIYDVPEAYERNRFASDVSTLMSESPIYMPIYDMASNRRLGSTKKVWPKNIIIAEGIFAASFLDHPDLGAFHIYMETTQGECLTRKIERDTARYKVSGTQVIRNFTEKVAPYWARHQQSEKTLAHVIVDDHQ